MLLFSEPKLIESKVAIPRMNVTLLFLACIPGAFYGCTQLQKGMFLIARNLPDLFEVNYDFKPEAYGPGDMDVYRDVNKLDKLTLAKVVKNDKLGTEYAATHVGIKYVQQYDVPDRSMQYIKSVAEWVLPMSMTKLIASIIGKYPEYATNMIFRD